MKKTHKYDDIIDLSHPVSPKRSRMSLYDRAAQFSPFAALTGYDGVIQETARLTDAQIELDEGGRELLDEKLRALEEVIDEKPAASFTCFVPDKRKLGGSYVKIRGRVKKIDPAGRCIVLTDGQVLSLERICEMEL